MRIPEDKIQEVRDATDILEIVTRYVTLKKRGKSYVGLCPFHNEKTPSFNVDPVRGFYHCFGCGEGGNVFSFLMRMERIGFPEAVRHLAEKANIELPAFEEDNQQEKEMEALYRANRIARDFFSRCLMETEEGEKTRSYLLRRGFSQAAIDHFELGLAPDRWDGLIRAAQKASCPESVLHKAGLIIPRKAGTGFYDRFRGRWMFPIMNPSGRVVGFGGRNLKKEGSPKYLNSPETPIYQKSRILYGLYQCKNGIRREDLALLVEGYTDCIQLHQHGFDYCAATSGTALTEQQAQLLCRYTKNVMLVFDGDSAGFRAALRGIDILVEAGLHVRVAPLPKGTDPDSLIRDQGKEAFMRILQSARTFVDFQIESAAGMNGDATPQSRAQTAKNLIETVSRVRDPIERSLMIKDISEKTGIDEVLIHRQLRDIRRDEPDRKENETMSLPAVSAAEKGILALLFAGSDTLAKRIFQLIGPDEFTSETNRIIAQNIRRVFTEEGSVHAELLLDRFSEDERILPLITELLSMEWGEDVDREQYGIDCIIQFRQGLIQRKMVEIKQQIRRNESEKKDIAELKHTFRSLDREMRKMRQTVLDDWKKNVEI